MRRNAARRSRLGSSTCLLHLQYGLQCHAVTPDTLCWSELQVLPQPRHIHAVLILIAPVVRVLLLKTNQRLNAVLALLFHYRASIPGIVNRLFTLSWQRGFR